jgi:hypothetical protein
MGHLDFDHLSKYKRDCFLGREVASVRRICLAYFNDDVSRALTTHDCRDKSCAGFSRSAPAFPLLKQNVPTYFLTDPTPTLVLGAISNVSARDP